MAASVVLQKRVGVSYWMHEVLYLSEKATEDLSSDPVHDLRTALRRCRSMADGIAVFDRNPAWKKMKRAAKQVFSSLGGLRDIHVMSDWVEKLALEGDTVKKVLVDFLAVQENTLKESAVAALQGFDRKQWRLWADELPSRAARIPLDSPVFAHLALERWEQAYVLHRRALRDRTNIGFHDLRIGVKRLRYTVENFLPRRHETWGNDLKEVQDLLGEVHDLDVLWETTVKIKAFPDIESREQWRSRTQEERGQRLNAYREKMVGSNSLWRVWRASLPRPEERRSIALERLQIWASFLDPNVTHTKHVARLALQLYDGLPAEGILRGPKREEYRCVLQAAAYMHDVGRSRTNNGHHKASARLIRKLHPPSGWTSDEISIAALVARYHRGALPRDTQKSFAALSQSKQRLVQLLGGILRLACACDQQHDKQIRRVEVESSAPALTIRAMGYSEYTSLAEHLAAARHLLELSYHRPVFILPLQAAGQARAA
jgi:CHAD domain-containing protein